MVVQRIKYCGFCSISIILTTLFCPARVKKDLKNNIHVIIKYNLYYLPHILKPKRKNKYYGIKFLFLRAGISKSLPEWN